METVILAVNAKYVHAALAPWYLKAAVRAKNAGCGGGAAQHAGLLREPAILETHINRPAEEILSEILGAKPDILGIGCYIWNMEFVVRLLEEIPRLLPGCILLLGGPEVSYNSAERLRELPMVDYIICGEGEEAFVRLLSLLHREAAGQAHGACAPDAAGWDASVPHTGGWGASVPHAGGWDASVPHAGGWDASVPHAVGWDSAARDTAAHDADGGRSAIPGLTWRKAGTIMQNRIQENAGAPPDPFLPEFYEHAAGRIVYAEASRGCPFRCGFCLSGRQGGVRYFDLGQAKRNLAKLANSGAKTVKLVDRTFNCHPSRSRALIRFLIDAHKEGAIAQDVRFHLETAADLFDRGAVELLRGAPAGLFQLEIGLQSFHGPALAIANRRSDLNKAVENIKLLRENNTVHLHLDLIAGLPGEDYQAFGRSFDQAFALSPHMLQLGFLKLLHGSRLRERSRLYGIEYDAFPPYRVRRTGWLDERELADIALCEDALGRLYNSGRFPGTCVYLLGATGAPPPSAFLGATGTPPIVSAGAAGAAPPAVSIGGDKPAPDALRGVNLSPFQFFSALGRFTGSTAAMPLEDYIAKILLFAQSIAGAGQEAVRDCLVVDWLQTNRVGVLPLCLRKEDRANAKAGRILEGLYRKSAPSPDIGSRRPYGFGMLYGAGKTQVALADYRRPKPVLGNYPLRILDPEDLPNIDFERFML